MPCLVVKDLAVGPNLCRRSNRRESTPRRAGTIREHREAKRAFPFRDTWSRRGPVATRLNNLKWTATMAAQYIRPQNLGKRSTQSGKEHNRSQRHDSRSNSNVERWRDIGLVDVGGLPELNI